MMAVDDDDGVEREDIKLDEDEKVDDEEVGTENDEKVARELAKQLEAELALEEQQDEALAQSMAEEDVVVLTANVHCISDLEPPHSNDLFGAQPLRVRVAAAVASNGELIASESTDLVDVDPKAKSANWTSSRGDSIQFTLSKSSLLHKPATLCFTLFLSREDQLGCCAPCFPATDAQPFAATGVLPLCSRDGLAADWLDSAPRDHILDDGAVLTVSSSLAVPPSLAAAGPAVAATTTTTTTTTTTEA